MGAAELAPNVTPTTATIVPPSPARRDANLITRIAPQSAKPVIPNAEAGTFMIPIIASVGGNPEEVTAEDITINVSVEELMPQLVNLINPKHPPNHLRFLPAKNSKMPFRRLPKNITII